MLALTGIMILYACACELQDFKPIFTVLVSLCCMRLTVIATLDQHHEGRSITLKNSAPIFIPL